MGIEIAKKNNSKIGETLEREIDQLEGQIADLEGEAKEVKWIIKFNFFWVSLAYCQIIRKIFLASASMFKVAMKVPYTQPTFTCSELTIETLKQSVKYVQN